MNKIIDWGARFKKDLKRIHNKLDAITQDEGDWTLEEFIKLYQDNVLPKPIGNIEKRFQEDELDDMDYGQDDDITSYNDGI